MKNLKVVLIVFIAGALSMSLQAKKVSLKYTLEKGSEMSYLVTQNQEIGQEMMGQMQEMTSDISNWVTLTVKDITPEGNYLMVKSLTRFKVVSGSPMGDMEFDSDNTNGEASVAKTVNLLIDNPVEFTMNAYGEVLNIVNADVFLKSFEGMIEGASPEMQMLAGIAASYSTEEGISQSIESLLFSYPTEKVKTGKAWETKSSRMQMVNFVSTVNTMVNELKGTTAVLTQEAKIEIGDGDNVMEMQGMQMEYQLTGDKKGSFEVDTKTGLIIKGEGVTSISGVVSIDSPQLPAPMSIPMTITTTEKTERL